MANLKPLGALAGRVSVPENCRAGSYGSEGWGFESLWARSVLRQTTRPLTSGNAGGGLCRVEERDD
jgi:hypothetical protein